MRAILTKSVAASLVTGLLVAGTLEVRGAAAASPPPAMTFATQEVARGQQRAPGGKVLAADGANFYTVYQFVPGEGKDESVMLSRGGNGGTTWEGPYTVAKTQPGLSSPFMGVAVGGDPSNTTQRIVHVVWQQHDDTAQTKGSLYYSWADSTNLNRWSTPHKINGPIQPSFGDAAASVVAGKNGAIHVQFRGSDGRLYVSSARDRASSFTPPAPLPGKPKGDGDPDMTLDVNNNLHVAFISTDDEGKVGVQYTKKAAGSDRWTAPVTVLPLTNAGGGGFCSIASYGEKNIYIAFQFDGVGLLVFSSADGGASWKKSAVATATATSVPALHVSIVAGPNRVLTVGTNFDEPAGGELAKVFRSTDGGITWGKPASFPGLYSVSMAIDGSGKAGIMTIHEKREATPPVDVNYDLYFLKEK